LSVVSGTNWKITISPDVKA